jgi:DNA polymerase III sliding clamp (beta) subunit (PCNA family)
MQIGFNSKFLLEMLNNLNSTDILLACIIHAFSLMQIRGIEISRYINIFQGFRNKVDALK